MTAVWRAWCLVVVVALGVVTPTAGRVFNTSDYLQQRRTLLAKEQTDILGQAQVLTAAEEEVNKVLMGAKGAEMDAAFETLNFLPAQNFLTVVGEVEASQVYKMIQHMPKGAALHVHETALTSASWVVQEITYWPNLYMCYDAADHLLFKFFEVPDTSCTWELVSEVRDNYVDPQDFDDMIFSRLTLLTDNPDAAYPDIDAVWSAFQGYFITITNLVMYRPAWEAYLYQALKEFAEDNVLYVEFRGTLPPLYELDGRQLTDEETVAVYWETAQRFQKENADRYFGTRFIYAPPRGVDNTTMLGYVSLMQRLKEVFPGFVAGFDMVGQEDKGQPLISFVDTLLQLSEADIKVFYHAGETNWMGMATDDNLIDALLLNASRIGHGYAIVKHPEAKALAKERGVPIEVCPISNQVLKLVEDLRNHPAAGLVAEGFPLVVSSDDPGAWGAKGLSHDFYEAFMALGGAKADLRFLKQLAINSIKYSSLDEDGKYNLMSKWIEKWDEFVEKGPTLLAGNKLHPTKNTTTQPDLEASTNHSNLSTTKQVTTTKPTTTTSITLA